MSLAAPSILSSTRATASSIESPEICVQPSMIGKTLVAMELPRRYGILVAGIRRGTTGKIILPIPSEPLLAGDKLLIVSSENAISSLIKGV